MSNNRTESIWQKEVEILLGEKEHANRIIDSNMDLNIKIIGGIITAVTVILGWIFAAKDGKPPTGDTLALLLVIVSALISSAMLWNVLVYGIALTYIDYKDRVIGARLRDALKLDRNPMEAVSSWRTGKPRLPVMFAYASVMTVLVAVNITLLFTAHEHFDYQSTNYYIFVEIGAVLLFLASIVAVALQLHAMKLVGVSPIGS